MTKKTLAAVALVSAVAFPVAVSSALAGRGDVAHSLLGPSGKSISDASIATAHRVVAPTVKVAHTKIGTILVDSQGRTLYYCTCDTPVIQCTTPNSECPTLWPPLLVTSKPTAGTGINPKLLGTVHRKQPTAIQVTYNHHPLYRYTDDTKPGDLWGQTLYNLWYVLAPSGKPIKKAVSLTP